MVTRGNMRGHGTWPATVGAQVLADTPDNLNEAGEREHLVQVQELANLTIPQGVYSYKASRMRNVTLVDLTTYVGCLMKHAS